MCWGNYGLLVVAGDTPGNKLVLTPKVEPNTLTSPHTDIITAKAIIPQSINCLPSSLFPSSSEFNMKNLTTPHTKESIARANINGIIDWPIRQVK